MKRTGCFVLAVMMCAMLFMPAVATDEKPYVNTVGDANPLLVIEEAFKTTSPIDAGTPTTTKDSYKIGISLRWAWHPFVASISKGVQDCAKKWEEALGVPVEVIVTSCTGDSGEQQVADLEYLHVQGVDGAVMFANDPIIFIPTLTELYAASNIPMALADGSMDSTEYLTWVSPDYKVGGAIGADIMAEILPKGSKVIIYNHGPGAGISTDRVNAFYDRAIELGLDPYPVAIITDQTPEVGMSTLSDSLTAYPDIAGVFMGTNTAVPGFLAAMEEFGREDIKIVCYDLDEDTLNYVAEGKVYGSVVNDPYGEGWEGLNQVMYYLTGQYDRVYKRVLPATRKLTVNNWQEFEDDPQVIYSRK